MKARSRIIKPELYQNEDFAKLSKTARLLFPGLWMLADREGLLKDNPALIKGMLFPYETVNPDKYLKELDEAGFIVRYGVQNIAYIWIPKFKKHQKPHPKETQSVIELPEKVVLGFTEDKPKDNLLRGTSSSISDSNSTSNVGQKPDDMVVEIIRDLNTVCKTDFKSTTDSTIRSINARLGEGYTLDDFKKVHRIKFEDWEGTEQQQYLRPSTLYQPAKFESYLNQANTEGVEAERKKTPAEIEIEKLNLDLKKQGIV